MSDRILTKSYGKITGHVAMYLAMCLLFCLLATQYAAAQNDILFDETGGIQGPDDLSTSSVQQRFRACFQSGYLGNGAEAEDLDQGIFGWDWATYNQFDVDLSEKDELRLRHDYWKYLSGNNRNRYQLRYRRWLKPFHGLLLTGEYQEYKYDYWKGMAYVGYQGLAGRDHLYAIQAGYGYDSNSDQFFNIRMEGIKPLAPTTVVYVVPGFTISPTNYRSTTMKVQLAQALHRRLAASAGWRFYYVDDYAGPQADLMSNEPNLGLTWQARDNLYILGGYRHYWNDDGVHADIPSLGFRWALHERFELIGEYEAQFFYGSSTNHAGRVGIKTNL
ncbi:MAG: hypothetical protein ACLFUS_11120 [Candidatus Sumerlaeia bacterium]